VAVRVAGVELLVEHLVAQLLVVVAAQVDADVVDQAGLHPREVLRPEAGVEQLAGDDVVPALRVVAVDLAREGGHLLVDAGAEARGHGEQRLLDLLVGQRPTAGLGDHARRQRR
jgi:hypothetical protein